MPRKLCLVLALCLALALTGCGGAEEPVSIDLDAFYGALAQQNDFPMMMAVDSAMMEGLYPGLADIGRVQTVIYTAAISATACEIAMVEVADAADTAAVKEIFQQRVDSQVAGGAWYPETIEAWKNGSEIVVRDHYVALFVTPPEMTSPAEAFKTA